MIAWDSVAPIRDANPTQVRLSVTESKLSRMHPSELAEIISDLSAREAAAVVSQLDDETAADAFEHLDAETQSSLIEDIGTERAADIIEEMDADDAADLLSELDEEQQHELLAEMNEYTAGELRALVKYAEDTAGGLMTTDYTWIYPHRTRRGDHPQNSRDRPDVRIYLLPLRGRQGGHVARRALAADIAAWLILRRRSTRSWRRTSSRFIPTCRPRKSRPRSRATISSPFRSSMIAARCSGSSPSTMRSTRSCPKTWCANSPSLPLVIVRVIRVQTSPDSLAAAPEAPRRRPPWRSLVLLFAVLGPGFVTASAGNDVGGIATYSSAGAQFGYNILWLMIPLAVALIVVQEMSARMGCVTGKGLAALIRESFGVRTSFFAMIVLFLINTLITSTEFAGIAAAAEHFDVSRYIAVPVALLAVFFFVLRFNSKIVERVFVTFSLIYLTYIVSAVLAQTRLARRSRRHVHPTL